jgi:glycosyltransferase involved in cell wall biosynthesis
MSRTHSPPPSRLRIAVIIPAHNEAMVIEGCLKALAAQIRPADLVIVVDNNCTDTTKEIVARFPFVQLVKESTQGLIHARNCGFDLAASSTDIICRTDADGRPAPQWLVAVEAAFLRDPKLIGLTGRSEVYGGLNHHMDTLVYTTIYQLTKWALGGKEYMRGPNTALRSSVWPQLRQEVTLDDRLVHEDMDISVRAARYGQVAFSPEMRMAVHIRTIRKSPRSSLEYISRWLRTARYLRHVVKAQ